MSKKNNSKQKIEESTILRTSDLFRLSVEKYIDLDYLLEDQVMVDDDDDIDEYDEDEDEEDEEDEEDD